MNFNGIGGIGGTGGGPVGVVTTGAGVGATGRGGAGFDLKRKRSRPASSGFGRSAPRASRWTSGAVTAGFDPVDRAVPLSLDDGCVAAVVAGQMR